MRYIIVLESYMVTTFFACTTLDQIFDETVPCHHIVCNHTHIYTHIAYLLKAKGNYRILLFVRGCKSSPSFPEKYLRLQNILPIMAKFEHSKLKFHLKTFAVTK